FDGYGRGELDVRVPLGWRVVVDCENRGGLRHSCAIVRGSLSVAPAFRGASSPQPLTGLSPGAKATFSFTASRTGTFRIACLVAGQEQARMFDVLEIVRGGTPAISVRPGPRASTRNRAPSTRAHTRYTSPNAPSANGTTVKHTSATV